MNCACGNSACYLLLDTHAFVWWLEDFGALSPVAKAAIADATNEIFVSAATVWEIATKHRLGKLPEAAPLIGRFRETLSTNGFNDLPVTLEHADMAGSLTGAHRDPFDRMLAAQALCEHMRFVSRDAHVDAFGVSRIW